MSAASALFGQAVAPSPLEWLWDKSAGFQNAGGWSTALVSDAGPFAKSLGAFGGRIGAVSTAFGALAVPLGLVQTGLGIRALSRGDWRGTFDTAGGLSVSSGGLMIILSKVLGATKLGNVYAPLLFGGAAILDGAKDLSNGHTGAGLLKIGGGGAMGLGGLIGLATPWGLGLVVAGALLYLAGSLSK